MDVDLDLSFTSSMVSEIAPIVAHLKYIIGAEKRFNFSGDPNAKFGLLFIEEPEAHLHPEVQVKLMEMFALLAGKNVKIVMTSHSNYMFNKLSNLLLEGKIEPDKVGSYLMRATDNGSVTDTLSMKAEADGMNDENFADVAEMLYEERIKTYDKLNKEAQNAH
jgi:predicted ATPase